MVGRGEGRVRVSGGLEARRTRLGVAVGLARQPKLLESHRERLGRLEQHRRGTLRGSRASAPTPVTLSDARASRYLPYTPRNKAAIAPPEATGFITNETVPEVIHEERRPVKGPASAAVGRPKGRRASEVTAEDMVACCPLNIFGCPG